MNFNGSLYHRKSEWLQTGSDCGVKKIKKKLKKSCYSISLGTKGRPEKTSGKEIIIVSIDMQNFFILLLNDYFI